MCVCVCVCVCELSGFQISFKPDWQIINGFFNRPIMACTQILLVNRWSLEQGFWCCFADLANQGLIISTTRLNQWTVDDNKVILVLLLLSLPLKK